MPGPRIGADLIPDHVRSSRRFQMPQFVVPPEGISFREVITDFEKRLIESTLEAAGGVQKRAAELLHIKPTTLNEMIKRYDIRPRRKRRADGRPSRAADAGAEFERSDRRDGDELGASRSRTRGGTDATATGGPRRIRDALIRRRGFRSSQLRANIRSYFAEDDVPPVVPPHVLPAVAAHGARAAAGRRSAASAPR